jgi:hypothetical protein
MESEKVRELKQIIEKHTVRYEVWPHYEIVKGDRVIVGFDLELYGTHETVKAAFFRDVVSVKRLTPTCATLQNRYSRTNNALRRTRYHHSMRRFMKQLGVSSRLLRLFGLSTGTASSTPLTPARNGA